MHYVTSRETWDETHISGFETPNASTRFRSWPSVHGDGKKEMFVEPKPEIAGKFTPLELSACVSPDIESEDFSSYWNGLLPCPPLLDYLCLIVTLHIRYYPI